MREKIAPDVDGLSENPRPNGCVKLHDGSYRIRVNDYRVRYDVDDDARTVIVLLVAHRREVYR